MIGMKKRIWAAVLAAWLAAPGSAIPTEAAPDATTTGYVHKPTRLGLPASLQGLSRGDVKSWEEGQLDEGINYTSPDQREFISIFIFRHVSGDASVWFDRIAWYVEHRDIYGGTKPVGPVVTFTPPGQSTASGIMQAYKTSSGSFRSTGAAIMPLGADWFVSIRYSSQKYDAAVLPARFDELIRAFRWPAVMDAQPAAALVKDCPAPLAFAKKAKLVKIDGAGALINAVIGLGLPDADKAKKEPAPPPIWCRDTGFAASAEAAMYRADAADNAYLLALADSGRGLSVGPDVGAVLMGGKPRWSLTQIDMRENRQLPPVDRLPAPEQALELLGQGQYLSSASTWGGDKKISIDGKTLDH